MDNYIWRSRARVVAYVDLVLTSLGLLVVLVLTLGLGLVTSYVATNQQIKDQIDKMGGPGIVWWAWLVVAVQAVLTGLQLWAALKLLSATEIERSAFEALDKARIWRNVTVVFFVCGIFIDILLWGWIVMVVDLIWRGALLFIVYKFIQEVETAVVSGGSSGKNYPDDIIVK